MATRDSYPAGRPSWVDLSSPDPDASLAFYGGLLGWQGTGAREEMGGYQRLTSGGHDVAGLSPMMGPKPGWMTYIATADAEATAAAVTSAGGAVAVPPMDVMGMGTMAVFADPHGATFGIWQAGTMTGAQLYGEPGAMSWMELQSPDPEAAAAFYAAVHGWSVHASEGYTEFDSDGEHVAGMTKGEAGRPAAWVPVFGVEDVDGVAARAAELGGAVQVPPTDFPGGRFAVLTDPHEVVFSVASSSS